MATLLPLLVVLLPLLITPGLLFHYDITPKILVLALGVAGCLALPRAVADSIGALWSRRTGRWMCLLAAAQILWFAVATVFSTRPWFSLLGGNWRRMGLLTVTALAVFSVLAAGALCRKPELSGRVLRASAVAAIVASFYGIAQYFDLDPLQSPALYHAEAGDSTIVRPPGTLGHADYFGWWLAIVFFCAVALARLEKKRWQWVGLAASGLSAVAIVLSGTRSALLGVAVGLVVLAVLAGFKPAKRHWVTAVAGLALLLLFYFSPAGTRLQARVRWSSDEPAGGARPLLWRDTLRMVAARPIAGFGPESFGAAFPLYQSAELSRLLPDFYHESPHNTALDALTSEGFPGLLLAAGWVALGGLAVKRTWHRRTAPGAALVAALIASCVASIFGAPTVGPVFATLLVIALLVALEPADPLARLEINPAAAFAVCVPVALCLTAFAVALAIEDWNMARFANSPDLAHSIALYGRVVRTALPGPGEDLYSARRLAALGAPKRLITDAAQRATSRTDNPPDAWYNLAMVSALQEDHAATENALRTAIALAPHWFKPHWALASVLALTGRMPEARIEAAQALQLDAGKHPEVRETVENITANTP